MSIAHAAREFLSCEFLLNAVERGDLAIPGSDALKVFARR